MDQSHKETAKVEKICLDAECSEIWNKKNEEMLEFADDFIFCPYCSEELHLQCSACKESLTSKEFKFCPWCGVHFEN